MGDKLGKKRSPKDRSTRRLMLSSASSITLTGERLKLAHWPPQPVMHDERPS